MNITYIVKTFLSVPSKNACIFLTISAIRRVRDSMLAQDIWGVMISLVLSLNWLNGLEGSKGSFPEHLILLP